MSDISEVVELCRLAVRDTDTLDIGEDRVREELLQAIATARFHLDNMDEGWAMDWPDREPGYYWVRKGEAWLRALWDLEPDGWHLSDGDMYIDEHFDEIGPRCVGQTPAVYANDLKENEAHA